MEEILRFAGSYWWLIFIAGPIVGGWIGAVAKYDEKRRRDRIELERVRRQPIAEGTPSQRLAEPSEAAEARVGREIERAMAAHADVDRRWLEFELDVAKLIDYPLMTDLREPLTQAFHRARRVAESLRPEDPDALRAEGALDRYARAVDDYAVAFETAEREARRRAQSGFSEAERGRLAAAQRLMALAESEGSTAAERQSAYRRARKELDGLIALPHATTDDIERRIAGELER